MAIIQGLSQATIKSLGKEVTFTTWKGKVVARKRKPKSGPPKNARVRELNSRLTTAAALVKLMQPSILSSFKYWTNGSDFTWRDQAISQILKKWAEADQEPIVQTTGTYQWEGPKLRLNFTFDKTAAYYIAYGPPLIQPKKVWHKNPPLPTGCITPPIPPMTGGTTGTYTPPRFIETRPLIIGGSRKRTGWIQSGECNQTYDLCTTAYINGSWQGNHPEDPIRCDMDVDPFATFPRMSMHGSSVNYKIEWTTMMTADEWPYLSQFTVDVVWDQYIDNYPWHLNLNYLAGSYPILAGQTSVTALVSGSWGGDQNFSISANNEKPPNKCPNGGTFFDELDPPNYLSATISGHSSDPTYLIDDPPAPPFTTWFYAPPGEKLIISPPLLVEAP